MRIGIDGRQLQHSMTGIGRYLKLLLENISGSPHEYILYCCAEPKEHFLSKNIRIRIISGKAFFWDHLFLPQALINDAIDVFFSPYYKRPWKLSCKSIITVHDITPLLCDNYSFFYKRYFSVLLRHSLSCADYAIVVSEYVKRQLVESFHVPSHKLIVNYNALDECFLDGDISDGIGDIPKKYGIQSEYILYVGNLMPHKNVSVLLKTYAQLPEELKQTHQLVIVGERSWTYKKLLALCNKLRLENNVIFTGFICESDLVFLYRQASLFAFPSLYEGFGFPPLEAMASGVPVVAFDTASLPEVVADAGILVNPNNISGFSTAMADILTDKSLSIKLSRQGRLRAQEFSAKKMTAGFLDILRKL